MSVMGFFFYPSKTKQTPRIYSLFVALVGVAICGALATTLFSSSAFAADAAWTNSDRKQISYGGKTFSGPNTNKMDALSWTGWSPGDDSQRNATFYRDGNEAVIWFTNGTSTGSASNANYSKLKNNVSFDGTPSYYTLESTTQITLGADQTSASLSVVKSIYRTSISDYVTSECQKSFNTNQERSECRSLVNSRFDSCFDGQVNDNSFTFNSSSPGNSVDLNALARCIRTGTEIGSQSQYINIFNDARDRANREGSEAYSSAAPTGTTPSDGEDSSSCRIDGLGWILCPVLNTTALLVDGAYGFVEGLLKVQPLLTTGNSQPLYDAWKMMRNFANICFVIAFLIIIFSQLTSFGVSNYGIKKLLPRIIVAAILVNVSYWICAAAVDVSNILGGSLRGLFKELGGSLSAPEGGIFSGTNPWANATGAVLAGAIGVGAVMYTTLAALLPALVAALAAIITVFLVLTLRQALIILLIVVAPLAFVALLLPNTESWFKKWRALLQTLLLMYPIIAIIFGASAFASQIVMQSADSENQLYKIAIQIMGALISILPLAITPLVMKTAGGLLNRFGGIVNNPNRGPIDKLRKGAQGYRDYAQDRARGNRLDAGGKFLAGSGGLLGRQDSRRRRTMAYIRSGGATGKVNQDQKRGFAKAVADENAQSYFAERVMRDSENNGKFAEAITGSDNERAAVALQASAKSAMDKIERQDKESRAILFRAKIDPTELNKFADEWKSAVMSGDTASARAANDILLHSGSKGVQKLGEAWRELEASEQGAAILGDTTPGSMSSVLRQDINGSGLKGKDNGLATLAFTGGKLTDIADNPNTYAELTPTELVGQSAANLQVAAQTMSPSYAAQMLDNKDVIKDLSPTKAAILEMVRDGKQVPMPSRTKLEGSADIRVEKKIEQQIIDQASAPLNERAKQTQQQAAQGSAGTKPFVVDSSGIATSTDARQSTAAAIKVAADGSVGTQPFVVDSKGVADVKIDRSTTTVNQNLNQTNTWTPASGPTPQSPSGRRSTGTPFDTPGTSIREPGSDPRYAKPPTPRDNPANIPDPRDFQ